MVHIVSINKQNRFWNLKKTVIDEAVRKVNPARLRVYAAGLRVVRSKSSAQIPVSKVDFLRILKGHITNTKCDFFADDLGRSFAQLASNLGMATFEGEKVFWIKITEDPNYC